MCACVSANYTYKESPHTIVPVTATFTHCNYILQVLPTEKVFTKCLSHSVAHAISVDNCAVYKESPHIIVSIGLPIANIFCKFHPTLSATSINNCDKLIVRWSCIYL